MPDTTINENVSDVILNASEGSWASEGF